MNFKDVISVALNVYNLPLFREMRNSSDQIVYYGYDNTYPAYLTDMFNQSAVHNAIVTAKVNFITGRGLEINKPNPLFTKPNKYESINEVFYKAAADYELNNGYSFEIVKDAKGKIIEIFHIDYGRLRKATDGKGYWYSTEWTTINEDGERIRKITPKRVYFPKYKTGAKDERSVYVFNKYRPDFDHYPLPDYVGALSAIETAVEIDNYHLNNIKNGFSAGTMVSFNNGIPEDEKKDEILKGIKKKATGSNRAGEVFVTFSVDKDHAPEILHLQSNDLDKKYEQLALHVQEQIFIGHKVTNPALFGVQVAGKLGNQSKEELTFAYEQFKEMYVIHRQADLLSGLTEILEDAGGNGIELEVIELKPILPDLPLNEAVVLSYIPESEIAKYIANRYGVETLELPKQAGEVTKAKLSAVYDPAEYFKQVGKSYPNAQYLYSGEVDTHGDAVKFAYNDVNEFKFAENVSKLGESILNVYNNFPSATPQNIANMLNEPLSIIKAEIGTLLDNGYIDVKKGETSILPQGKTVIESIPKREQLKIVYSYEERTDVPKPLTESRPFCAEMVNMSKNGKRWTKEEIEGLNNDMSKKGFIPDIQDVWKYRGGWYRNPNSDVAVPFCRHYWKQHIIIE